MPNQVLAQPPSGTAGDRQQCDQVIGVMVERQARIRRVLPEKAHKSSIAQPVSSENAEEVSLHTVHQKSGVNSNKGITVSLTKEIY